MSITSQRSTVVNLDRHGKPLRPAIVWLDQRRARNLPSVGYLWQSAFRLTGLPEGLMVIAAASDKACEVLGTGCLKPYQGCVGYGTTATINVNSNRYTEPVPLIHPYPSACPGYYNLEMQIYQGLLDDFLV